jgi:hypothetical protein
VCVCVCFAVTETKIKKSEHPRPAVPTGDGGRDVPQQPAVQGLPQVIPHPATALPSSGPPPPSHHHLRCYLFL